METETKTETEFCSITFEKLFFALFLNVNLVLRGNVKGTVLDTKVLYQRLSSEVRQRQCLFLMQGTAQL